MLTLFNCLLQLSFGQGIPFALDLRNQASVQLSLLITSSDCTQFRVPLVQEEIDNPSFVSTISLKNDSTSKGVLSSAASLSVISQYHLLQPLKYRLGKLSAKQREKFLSNKILKFHLPCSGCEVFVMGAGASLNSHRIVEYHVTTESFQTITEVSITHLETQETTRVVLSKIQLSFSVGDQVLLNNQKGGTHFSNAMPIFGTVARIFETSMLLVTVSKPSVYHGLNSDSDSFKSVHSSSSAEVFSLRVSKRNAVRFVLPVVLP